MDTPVFTSVLLGTVVMGVKLFTAVDFPTLAKGHQILTPFILLNYWCFQCLLVRVLRTQCHYL